jgi:hypothetical protein
MKNKRDDYDVGDDVQEDPLMPVALSKSQYLIESGVWNMMYPYQERLVALISEVNMLLNYSRSCNPTRVHSHTQRHIQAPIDPLNLGVCLHVCALSQGRT